MGWKWSESSSSSSFPSLGFRETSELENPNPRQEADRCWMSRTVKSKCKTHEIEPGKFVRKCEKTEELLRECVGRPVEVVESNTECTEEDVTDKMARGSLPTKERFDFDFPGLRDEIKMLERNMFDGLSQVFDAAAEEMKNGFFQSFGMQRKPADGFFEKEASKKKNESEYTEFPGQVIDV